MVSKSPFFRILPFSLVLATFNFLSGPAAVAASPELISLGSSTNFALLASGAITTGAPIVINGDIGAGAAITTGK